MLSRLSIAKARVVGLSLLLAVKTSVPASIRDLFLVTASRPPIKMGVLPIGTNAIAVIWSVASFVALCMATAQVGVILIFRRIKCIPLPITLFCAKAPAPLKVLAVGP